MKEESSKRCESLKRSCWLLRRTGRQAVWAVRLTSWRQASRKRSTGYENGA